MSNGNTKCTQQDDDEKELALILEEMTIIAERIETICDRLEDSSSLPDTSKPNLVKETERS